MFEYISSQPLVHWLVLSDLGSECFGIMVSDFQQSVETILRDYFMHTMEKIECLCSQMMRNECLLSKMYLDVMDKISAQSEKSLRQFKCLCQFLAETHTADDNRQRPSAEKAKCRCFCNCDERPEFGQKGRRSFARPQGSDTDGRTLSADGSVSSCTTPHLYPKSKSKPRMQDDLSNTSYTEEVRQVAQVITEYHNIPRLNLLDSPRLDAPLSDLRRSSRKQDENKLISVKSGPSDTDLSLSRV